MFLCFETKSATNKHLYSICSVTLGALWDNSGTPISFTQEASIEGVPFMGCGVFGTKIVLAGGLVQLDKTMYQKSHPVHETHKPVYVKNKGVITYDIITKEVSTTDIPMMRGGKVKPLVFEINKKLYVLDTNRDLSNRSFEVYYPNQKYWHQIENPYFHRSSPYIVHSSSFLKELLCFSWFVFGDCICISLPKSKLVYLHHTKYMMKTFNACCSAPLPFHGMAITFCQHDFEDSVLITFCEGRIEGRRLRISFYDSYDEPVLIFDTETHGDMSGYFAELGKGNFCLTAFDKAKIHFYTFSIIRRETKNDGKLNLELVDINLQIYNRAPQFTIVEPFRSLIFAGCLALPGADRCKETLEAGLYCSKFTLCKDEEEEDDIAGKKCIHLSDGEDSLTYDTYSDL